MYENENEEMSIYLSIYLMVVVFVLPPPIQAFAIFQAVEGFLSKWTGALDT